MSRSRLILWVPLGLLFTACAASREGPAPLPAQEEAGSVHVSILSAAPWPNYVDALQPRFNLTADQAVKEVLRIGQISSTDEFSGTRVEAGIGVGDGASGKVPPSGMPGSGKPSGGKKGVSPTAYLPGADVAVKNPQRDAHTVYANAAALYQEVQLLNRYIKDAAIPKGYAAYVLRLQMTLLPRRRDAPFDAYSTLSFFSVGEGRIPRTESMRSDESSDPAADRGPRVLPLLVTDNLEMAASSRSQAQLRELALALGGTSGSVAGSLGVESVKSKLDSLAGLDLNSLLAVARISENTLMVRLGAMQQGSTRFAMVPRNHNVTVVVLLPEGGKSGLQVLARTVFKDATTGEELPQRSPERIKELLLDAGRPYGVSDVSALREMAGLARRNQLVRFEAAAKRSGVEMPLELWVDLVGLWSGGQYSSVTVDLENMEFSLPEIQETSQAVLPDAKQEIEIDDDGTRCRIVLRGGRNLRPKDLEARLFVGEAGKMVPIEAVRFTVEGEDLVVELPSLSARHITIDDKSTAYLRLNHRSHRTPREFRNLRRR